ncbi:uncharacterized protein I303_102722 [Kwoniella dejecticola CBS 10117]|uniref:Fe2OG dioxygenase domain-containing protein n=1 Tax=Kwoniella dejecticola CBS 10117 TaxID=1296121 RepID=A0A1A6A9K0_9TREE|nr:uncharacterized protein I303_02737 [Kwoniella dejecticola CBS 10117]OBR86724.1 hypothetical protein I303_02737 [Kwoniella dejecticola CBS 10117]
MASTSTENQDDEDTDTKLALLSSLLEPISIPFDLLLEALNEANGDVSKAAEALLIPKVRSAGKRKAGTSISSWLKKPRNAQSGSVKVKGKEEEVFDFLYSEEPIKTSTSGKTTAETELASGEIIQAATEGTVSSSSSSSPAKKPIATTTNVDLLSILRGPSTSSTMTPTTTKAKNGPQPPISLSTQKSIDAHGLPITLLESPLPSSLASALYLELMQESERWYHNEFYLAGKAVKSPHTVQMYKYPDPDSNAWKEGVRYWYSGTSMIDIADYPPLLRKAADLVEKSVNESLRRRKRFALEWAGDWKANCCGTNRYDGAKSSVGWHADQLTYLGPYTTIASLSLGTPRAFRLRETNTVDPAFASSSKPIRTYELNLGHNSLCLMNGGCQERFKHTVPPQKALDLFRPAFDANEDPILLCDQKTYTSRINITFRFYRDDFHPDPAIGPYGPREGTPLCKCGIPTLLRADQKGKTRSKFLPPSPKKPSSKDENEIGDAVAGSAFVDDDMMYFWQCQSPAKTGDMKGCGFFKILDMKKEGRGPCLRDPSA